MKHNPEKSSIAPVLSLIALGTGLFTYCAAVLLAGGNVVGLLLFWAAFGLCVLGSGSLAVGLLAPGLQGVDRLLAAFLPGCTLLFLGYAAAYPLGARGPWVLLPSAVLGLAALALRWKEKKPAALCAALRPLWPIGFLLGAALVLYAVWGILPFAQADRLKAWVYHQDMIWSIGNAAAVRFGLPFSDMRAAGLTLNYHFFNDALAGLLAWGTGCTAWQGLAFYWYGPVLALAITGLYRVARLMDAAPLVAAAAVAVVYFGSPAASTLPTNLFTNANAQGTAMAALAGILLLCSLPAPTEKAGLLRRFVLALLSFSAACMIKSTIGALLLLALAAALAVGVFTRQFAPHHLCVLAGGALGFGLAYTLVLSHAINNLLFAGLAQLRQLPQALTTHLALPILLLYFAGLIYSLLHFSALTTLRLTLNAAAVGGMLAVVLYSHYSASHLYFALTAVPCAVLSLLPFVSAAQKRFAGRVLPIAGGIVLAFCMAAQLYTAQDALRTGTQAALRCLGLREYPASETTLTDEDWAAAQWLRTNTPQDAVFMTNRNNKQQQAAEGVFHFYSAASQRRCYLESYRYALDYDAAYHEIRRRLEQVSDAVFFRLPEADAFALAREEQVDYLLVSLLVPDAPRWQATPVYENQYIRLYAVPR